MTAFYGKSYKGPHMEKFPCLAVIPCHPVIFLPLDNASALPNSAPSAHLHHPLTVERPSRRTHAPSDGGSHAAINSTAVRGARLTP
jgi:hypothetical protein